MRPHPPTRFSRSDLLLAGVLFAATTLYVAVQPRNLSPADESVYLYQAKRVLEGAVPYRDVFEITTPGWLYLMAGLFGVFGTDLATARIAAAVMHGLTAVLIYVACRRLGVRPALSWPAALAYLVVSQPAWPIASQHWLGTLFTVLLLAICTGASDRRIRWAFWPGVVIGLQLGVHQQRGVWMGVGVFVWLIVDHLLQRRSGISTTAPLLPRLAWLAAGAAVVVVPLGIFMIASAGFEPVWQALIIHPLVSYRSAMHATWGQTGLLMGEIASDTFPTLLKYLPLVLLLDVVRIAALAVRRGGGDELRRLVLLVVFGASAILSIAYFPDYIHIAFIAPLFFVAAAEQLEWLFGALAERSQVVRAAGVAAGVLLLLACGWRLQQVLERSRARYAVSRDTAFGRVDFASPREAQLYDRMDELMQQVPSRELFCYPIVSYLYLMLDADNPTRFQFMLPGYTTPEQMAEVVGVLEERKLPYIVVFTRGKRPDDPVMDYLRRDYEPLSQTGDIERGIYRRKQG